MTHFIKRVLPLLALILVVAACGGLDDKNNATVGTGEHSVTFVNNTGTRICYVFVSPSTATEWGDDMLGDTGILNSGGRITVRVAEAGSYDLLAVLQTNDTTCDGNGAQIDQRGFAISGDVEWSVTR